MPGGVVGWPEEGQAEPPWTGNALSLNNAGLGGHPQRGPGAEPLAFLGRPMTRRHYVRSGSSFEAEIGYVRAVVEAEWVFVSGTTGFDYGSMTIVDDVVGQAEQALRNIGAALAEAGARFGDVVRVRYILPDRADFEPCWPVLRACFAESPPAATMIVAGLSDPRMKIEIEVTARRRIA